MLPAALRSRSVFGAILDDEKGGYFKISAVSPARCKQLYLGSDQLDASLLLMPLVFLVSPSDPRMIQTVERTQERLAMDSLVHRYSIAENNSVDGVAGREGAFSVCSFWLVEALTRAGRVEEARLMFEKMLGYANYVGLYAEKIGHCGEALGNFPQALTHLGLISAAYN